MIFLIAFAAQAVAQPPVELTRLPDAVPMVLPDRPWTDQDYTLQCEVSDSARHQGSFALTLSHLGSAEISGDAHFGLDTNGGVLTNESPPAEHPNVLIRSVAFDGGNLSYVFVTQAFVGGQLQSTSFIARHTVQSDGIPNSHHALGFCFPTSNADEAVQ